MVGDLDQEERLLEVRDLLVVDLGEVLGDRGHLIIVHELVSHRILVKVYIEDDVSSLVTPVRNDGFLRELSSAHLLPAVLIRRVLLELKHAREAAGGRHELEDVVDGQGDAVLRVESGCLEAGPDLEALSWEIDRIHDVEESWRTTDLLQAGVSESLLDDDVDQVLGDRVVLVDKVRGQVHSGALVLVDLDDTSGTTVDCRPLKSLIDLMNSIDGLAGDNILPKSLLESHPLGADDGVDLVGLPELVGLDVEDVLVDKQVFSQGQLELI